MAFPVRASIAGGVAAAGLIACDIRSDVPVVEPQEGLVQSTDEIALHYRISGIEQDTVVVLHGGAMGLPLDYILPDLEPLARSHTLIFYDQRGSGRSTIVSDAERMTVAAHVEDLEAVRQHFGIDRMTLLGHSWGAGLASRYAALYPGSVSRLVLVGPMAIRNTPYTQEFANNLVAWMDSATQARVQALFEQAAAIDTATDPYTTCRELWSLWMRAYFADPYDMEAIQRMRGDICAGPEEALRNSSRALNLTYRSLGDWDWRNDFAHLDVPVLIIHGGSEPIPMAAAEEWVAAFPNARLVVIEGAGHYPHVERPEEFFSAVTSFLRQAGAAP